jgi:hypothetical protein
MGGFWAGSFAPVAMVPLGVAFGRRPAWRFASKRRGEHRVGGTSIEQIVEKSLAAGTSLTAVRTLIFAPGSRASMHRTSAWIPAYVATLADTVQGRGGATRRETSQRTQTR